MGLGEDGCQNPPHRFRARWLVGLGFDPCVELGELVGLEADANKNALAGRSWTAFLC